MKGKLDQLSVFLSHFQVTRIGIMRVVLTAEKVLNPKVNVLIVKGSLTKRFLNINSMSN